MVHIQRVWGRRVSILGGPRYPGPREPGPQNPAGIWFGTGFVPVLSGTKKRCRGPGTETDGAQPYANVNKCVVLQV